MSEPALSIPRSQSEPPTAFAFDEWWGEAAGDWSPEVLRRAVGRVVDPSHATRTLHWGRNYLYLVQIETPEGPLTAVVKQFPGDSRAGRLRWRGRISKAERSWRVARAMIAAGLDTPDPLLLVESEQLDGPSYYVSRHLDGTSEARYLLRAVNARRAPEAFPAVDVERFLSTLGREIRRLHDAGFWHRDLSSGNVLVAWSEDGAPSRISFVDLNRTRAGRSPSGNERVRDLSRMMVHRPEDQQRFLEAYWLAAEYGASARPPRLHRLRYLGYHRAFRWKNAVKRVVRERTRGVVRAAKDLVLPRGTHAHIPRAPSNVATRERTVWDPLSDQPHLHAGKLAKLTSRLGDAGTHARHTAAAARLLPRAWRRLREIESAATSVPVPFQGAGVAVRPWPRNPEGLLDALSALGVRHVLLRLHPWADDHGDEETLATELAGRGVELAFSLPQNRDLVRDPLRWRAVVAELGERFTPYGRHFQVGQAINRSKWGIWNPEEYRALATAACEELRRHPGVEVLGPAVIDWEPHATAGALGFPGMPRFDALASLLYVDRRGAPENRQTGFDALRKASFLAALADVAPTCSDRSWITEVNWPLREGPHSPAGRSVAVDEETQADYLVRYYVPLLASGRVERIYWWQAIARGYGLIAPEADDSLRCRPSWQAMATMIRQLAGTRAEGSLAAPAGARLHRFRRSDDDRAVVVAWSLTDQVELTPDFPVTAAVGRDGAPLPPPAGTILLSPSPVYLRIAQ